MVSNNFKSEAGQAGELVNIHSLWQTDRERAKALLIDFHNQFTSLRDKNGKLVYDPAELPDGGLGHFITRMDRQNRMTIDGLKHGIEGAKNADGKGIGPTSVWTSVVVRVAKGRVTEGVLTEVYPKSRAGVLTYMVAGADGLSKDIADLADHETRSKDNKRAIDGEATGYDGDTWENRMKKYGGTFIELERDKPTPAGFVRIPLTDHHMAPMKKGADYIPAYLYMKKDGDLTHSDILKVQEFLPDYTEVCLGEIYDDEALAKAVANDPHLNKSLAELREMEAILAPLQDNPTGRVHKLPPHVRFP